MECYAFSLLLNMRVGNFYVKILKTSGSSKYVNLYAHGAQLYWLGFQLIIYIRSLTTVKKELTFSSRNLEEVHPGLDTVPPWCQCPASFYLNALPIFT